MEKRKPKVDERTPETKLFKNFGVTVKKFPKDFYGLFILYTFAFHCCTY